MVYLYECEWRDIQLENITNLVYVISKIFLFIFGVVFVISPKKMINYFIEKDLKKRKENDKNTDESTLIKRTKIICRIGGIYCIVLILLDKVIRYSALAVIMGYFIIPFICLYLLEKKLK